MFDQNGQAYWSGLIARRSNRVTLSAEVDAYGTPGAAIAYRFSGNSERLLAWHAERALESLDGAGIRDLQVTRARATMEEPAAPETEGKKGARLLR